MARSLRDDLERKAPAVLPVDQEVRVENPRSADGDRVRAIRMFEWRGSLAMPGDMIEVTHAEAAELRANSLID